MLDGAEDLFVLPSDATGRTLSGHGTCWVLPVDALGSEPAWLVEADGPITARPDDAGWTVTVFSGSGVDPLASRATAHDRTPT